MGDAPNIQLNADYTVVANGDTHYYSGAVKITGCARDETSLAATVQVDTSHASLGDVGSFIESLGDGPAVPSEGGLEDLIPKPPAPPSCACRQAPVRGAGGGPELALAVSLLGLAAVRRRRAPASPRGA